MNKGIKVIYMGTPEFAVPTLKGLIDNYDVITVITQPNRISPSGKTQEPPVKRVADEHGIPVLQFEHIKEYAKDIKKLKPDIIIVCAYGQILPNEILEIPRLGCINVHASLLPKLRGGAPIHRAIINGHSKTGITIMYMASGMDTGDIISQSEVEITDTETANSLHEKLSILGRDLLLETMPSIIDKTNKRIPQDKNEVSYAPNITKDDERINFDKTKRELYNQIRGLNSWPGAYCLYKGKILKVWSSRITDNLFPDAFIGQITAIYEDGFGVKCNNGEIVLTTVQPEGKQKMRAIDFVNGVTNHEEFIGKILD